MKREGIRDFKKGGDPGFRIAHFSSSHYAKFTLIFSIFNFTPFEFLLKSLYIYLDFEGTKYFQMRWCVHLDPLESALEYDGEGIFLKTTPRTIIFATSAITTLCNLKKSNAPCYNPFKEKAQGKKRYRYRKTSNCTLLRLQPVIRNMID